MKIGGDYVILNGLKWDISNFKDGDISHFTHKDAMNEASIRNKRLPTPDEFRRLNELHYLYDKDRLGIWYANDVRDLKTRYSLFLPSGGYCPPGSTTPNYGVYDIGIYWANSFLLEDNVWHLYFDSDSIPGVDRYFREYKFTVRFVSDL